MKNWVIQGLLYDFNPSPYNYIKFKWHHFHFCKKADPAITASLYIDNLAEEVKRDITEQKSVNKKSLILAVIKKILDNKEAKRELIAFFYKKPAALNEDIKSFLSRVNSLINTLPGEKEQIYIFGLLL